MKNVSLFLVSFIGFALTVGCSDTGKIEEQSRKIGADTIQVELRIDKAVALPPLLVFNDESPRAAVKKGRTENMTISEVVATRYPANQYAIVEVIRTGDRFQVSIKKLSKENK